MPRPHDRFLAPATARPQLWRLLAGLVLIAVFAMLGVFAAFGGGWLLFGRDTHPLTWAEGASGGTTALGTLLLLFSFAGMGVGTALAARWLHRRPAGSLFGPAPRTLRDFAAAFAVVMGLMAVSLAVWAIQFDALPNLSPGAWLALLPLTVLGLAVQTGAEELVFRGYLQQQLGARFPRIPVWLVLPSLLFGLVHFDPALDPESRWIIVAAATVFGLAAADLTARTGSIGAAWGFHFANNFVAVGLLSTQGTINGLSLFLTPYGVQDTATLDVLILLDLGFVVLAWWLVRRVVTR